jgi:predicted XRE-type DNA-binding protein
MENGGRADDEFGEGPGNVFADMGLGDADGRLTRVKLGFYVHKIVKDRKLKPREVASLLGVKPAEAAHLLNGQFSRFTTDALLGFLERLGRKVSIRISPHEPGQPYREIRLER